MRIAVLGLARNCAETLPSLFESVAAWGLEARIVIGEDGSTDATRESIIANGELVDTTPPSPGLHRLARMARARELVKGAYELGAHADLVLVVDTDGKFAANIDASWLQSAHERLHAAGAPFALAATSRPYYDLLAFESDNASFDGLNDRIAAAKRRPFTYRGFKKSNIYAEQDRLTSNAEIECISAFNGAAIYLDSTYRTSSYLSSSGSNECEHISLHRTMARCGRRMIIDPSLVVPAPAEHTRQSLVSFYTGAARRLLKRA